MKTLVSLFRHISSSFSPHFLEPKREAETLLAHYFDTSIGAIYLDLDRKLSDEDWNTCLNWCENRLRGVPLAYLSGIVEFFGCEIEVNQSVLIPRQETEILVDFIARELETADLTNKILWDLCCGSGCIGIALKKRFPVLHVCLSDLSVDALAVATRNVARNQVNVEILHGHLLDPFQGLKTNYLVCNPPYISIDEYATLDKSVRDFEPAMALIGGKQGDEFYATLASTLPKHLASRAKVWFEIGYQQGKAVKDLFADPFWVKKEIKNDWAGHQRFFFLETE